MTSQDSAPQRASPANLEAEEAALGSLLIDPSAIMRIAPVLRPEDFYSERNRWIYEAVRKLHDQGQPPDFVTVCNELEGENRLQEIGGPAYITSLINSVPTAVHAEHYARIVSDMAVRRRLLDAATRIASLAYEEADDVRELVDRAEQIVFAIAERGLQRETRPISEVLDEVIERLDFLRQGQGEIYGVPTGFRFLDEMLGGLQRSDLVILAGRPAMGKTSLALSIARQTALRYSKKVALFSLEMSADQLVQRLLSAQSNIESQRMRKGLISEDEFTLLVNVAGMLGDTQIYIDDTPALTAMSLRSKARRLHSEYGLDLLVVDYLQLMQGDFRSENRVQEISYISRALKGLARELKIPVLALSQLSRAVESRHDKRPMLSDLRESGSIEQDADVVMFIYREEMYFQKEEEWERVQKRRSIHKDYPKDLADLIVAKHRNGPTGVVTLYFDRQHTDFRELKVQDVYLNPEDEYI